MDAKVEKDRVEEGRGIDGGDKEGNGNDIEKGEGEKLCRICHFSSELELITLGCHCKGELASSHHHCAQAWFTTKGDRICEICGKLAKNVNDDENERSTEWNEMRMVAASIDDSYESSRRCKRIFCNLMFATFLLIFFLLWFFHGINLL